MNGSNMRDKARAIFGKTFFENTKEPAPAKNAAVALQKRANARPIPTYKVGGVVKKQAGGALTAAEKARAQAMIKERGDAAMRDPLVMRYLDEQNRAPMSVPGMGPKAATKRAEGGRMGVPVNPRAYSAVGSRNEPKTISRRAEGGDIEAQRLEARAAAGRYKDGGNVQKKGDVSKPMGAMVRRMQSGIPHANQAVGTPNSKLADRGLEGFSSMMKKKMGDDIVVELPAKQVEAKRAYKKGGEIMKPVKRAVGGAGKTRKGMC